MLQDRNIPGYRGCRSFSALGIMLRPSKNGYLDRLNIAPVERPERYGFHFCFNNTREAAAALFPGREEAAAGSAQLAIIAVPAKLIGCDDDALLGLNLVPLANKA